jgi:hypothetical protein
MYVSKEKVHRNSFGQIVPRLRSIISAVVTIKWIIFTLLEKAMPVFWTYGFSNTSLQDLERATGVNKSGAVGT